MAAALYIAGACAGALFFGWLTDRLGRKKLFLVTLAVYLAATAAKALNTALFPPNVGWRLTFALGAIFGLIILVVRRNVPESPRWMFIHGRENDADDLVSDIEDQVRADTGTDLVDVRDQSIEVRQRRATGFGEIAAVLMRYYPRRTVLGFALFVGQAFLYNAITFNYALILSKSFGVPDDRVGYYFAVICAGNFLGPLLLGELMDTLGRKPMITGCYVVSAVLLLVTAGLFDAGALSALTLTACWTVVLFFASCGAGAAYLTVSEIFPMETRAMAIAFFYAIGTAAGGIAGPLVFSKLSAAGDPGRTALAFVIGAAAMFAAGLVELVFGVRAEGRSLEELARPLSATETDPAVRTGR